MNRVLHDRRVELLRAQINTIFLAAAFVLASVMTGGYVATPSFVRVAFAACLGILVIGLGIRTPRAVLYGLIVWLAALGLTRRLLSHGFSGPGSADPLLLVEPLALVILLVVSADLGSFKLRTNLGKGMLAFAVLLALGALNPLQGSMFAGVSALIFFVPVAAFWIGRTLPDRTLRTTLLVYAACGVPAALYGLFQISHGFPSWDQAWIDSSGYTALQVGSATRPFSSFSSASEYAEFLAAGIVVWLALGRRVLRPVALAAIALLGLSVFYQSSRGVIVALAIAFALVMGARRGFPLAASMAVGAAMLALLPTVVKHFAPQSFGSGNKSQLVAHQVQGLSDPFNSKQSTASAHISLAIGGIEQAFHQPLGEGISAVTIAGAKFGGSVTGGAEADPANAAVALGLPGLAVYLVIFALGLGGAYRLAQRTREPLALAALGILVVLYPQWLNGGQYAVAFLPWLVLGWVDGSTARAAAVIAEASAVTADAVAVVSPPPPRPRPALHRRARPRLAVAARRWELWRLERAVARGLGADRDADLARRYLIVELRSYVARDGRLPVEFDALVREELGPLLEEDA